MAKGGDTPQKLLQDAVGQANPAWIINGHYYNRDQLLDQLNGMGGRNQDYQLCTLGTGCMNTMLFPDGGHPCGYAASQAWCNFAQTTGTEAGWLGLADGAGGRGRGGLEACSFDPETPVLMADRSTKSVKDAKRITKAIKDIKKGDKVEATDPTGPVTNGESVTLLHLNTDTDLADVTVTGPDGHEGVLHTTQNHQFWDATTQKWTPAASLRLGDLLGTVNGDRAWVAAVRIFTGRQRMYNLTVSRLHTYYVIAGNRPVLVHNDPSPRGPWGNAQPWQGGDFPIGGANDVAGPSNGVLYRMNPDGAITNYAVYDSNGVIQYRVDLIGDAHGGVDTPHTQYYVQNTNPKTGAVYPKPRGDAVPGVGPDGEPPFGC